MEIARTLRSTEQNSLEKNDKKTTVFILKATNY